MGLLRWCTSGRKQWGSHPGGSRVDDLGSLSEPVFTRCREGSKEVQEEQILGLPLPCHALKGLSMRSSTFSSYPSHVCAISMFLLPHGDLSFSCNLSLSYLLWSFDDRWELIILRSCALAHRACHLCSRSRKLLSELDASSWNSSFTSGLLGGGKEGLCFSCKALYSLYNVVKAVVLKLSPFPISAAATILLPYTYWIRNSEGGASNLYFNNPSKWWLFMLTFENCWFWARGVGVWCFKMVPSVTVFWGSRDDSHVDFGAEDTLKEIWHPSEHLRAGCWRLPAHAPFPCPESSEGDLLPPHPQVTLRCVPFLHRKLKEEREILNGIEPSILGLMV